MLCRAQGRALVTIESRETITQVMGAAAGEKA